MFDSERTEAEWARILDDPAAGWQEGELEAFLAGAMVMPRGPAADRPAGETAFDPATATARRQVLELTHRVAELESELAHARGERDLARADLATVRAGAAGPPQDLARRLIGEPAGPGLAQAVGSLVGDLTAASPSGPLAGLTDDQVVELVTACQRVAAWATAAQLRAGRQLRERFRAASAADDEGYWETVETLALALGISRYAADSMLTAAEHLPARLPRVHALLVGAGLDWAKAKMLATRTEHLPDHVLAVLDAVLPGEIAGLTQPQLTARIEQLLAEADPTTHAEQLKDARARRSVRFRALDHGMGAMTLTTGGEIIEAVRARLDELTLAARTGHPGQRRGISATDPDNPYAPADPDGRHPAATRADTLTDLVLGAPDDSRAPRDQAQDGPAEEGERHSGTAPTGPTRRRADIIVLIPLSVLTGESDGPATLVGYGPVPAAMARELAADGLWRCAAVDDTDGSPTHGTLLGLGRSTLTPSYRPGPALREFVELRHGTCTFPGCRQQAHRCDLTHRHPWSPDGTGGATCDCTLHPLCPPHHRLKHHGRFTVTADRAGTRWTTPTGRIRTTGPVRIGA